MKYFEKLIIVTLVILFCSAIVQVERIGIAPNNKASENRVIKNNVPLNSITENDSEDGRLLLVYGKSSKDISAKDNMSKNLSYMKIEHECIEDKELNLYNLEDYKSVILIVSNLEEDIADDIDRILDYVNDGGNLIFGMVPSDVENKFKDMYKKCGIEETFGYEDINGLSFLEEVIPGSKERTFIDDSAFNDMCMNVKLNAECKVYIESAGDYENIPILWESNYGKGKYIFYNGTSLGGDYYCGVFAGVIALIDDDFMYPIINAKVVFIDDFPAPQYDTTSDIIAKHYNRTIKEFYRDVWWPDMNSTAKKNSMLYTGLFVTSYNDIVNPEEFVFENDPMEKYYGNSLLKNDYEIGLHGYNHQPLVGEGYLTEGDGENYNPWKSEEDMESSIQTLSEYSEELFPNTKFTSYVPPSNYLSQDGRRALRNVLPDLKVISGVFSDPDGKAYVQNFEKADDGIVEFPRLSAGMWHDDPTIFEYMSGLGLYGVFSHFVHPDDILDKERGRNRRWEELISGFNDILDDVNRSYKSIRSLRATEAADAVEVYEDLKVNLKYYDDYIEGQCDNFYGEAFFYLKTDKKPTAVNDECEINSVGEKSDKYYFVKIKSPEFRIELR